jgi:hypothetical protein
VSREVKKKNAEVSTLLNRVATVSQLFDLYELRIPSFEAYQDTQAETSLIIRRW